MKSFTSILVSLVYKWENKIFIIMDLIFGDFCEVDNNDFDLWNQDRFLICAHTYNHVPDEFFPYQNNFRHDPDIFTTCPETFKHTEWNAGVSDKPRHQGHVWHVHYMLKLFWYHAKTASRHVPISRDMIQLIWSCQGLYLYCLDKYRCVQDLS